MAKPNALQRLARYYNIQSGYRDGLGQWRQAPVEAVVQVLQALDAPLQRVDDAGEALRQRRQQLWQQAIEPVTVVWQDQPLAVAVRVAASLAQTTANYRIVLDNGATIDGILTDRATGAPLRREVEGQRYLLRRLVGPGPIPIGYHRLHLRIGALEVESFLVSAPLQAYTPDNKKRWGLFCPLYALRSAGGCGAGDFADLNQLVELTAQLGGHAVATLPMLASFLDQPFNPSPYAPVSRLFWNEFFLDLERIPDLENCPEAKTLLTTTDFESLRAAALVDYRAVMARKRAVLEALARSLLNTQSDRRNRFDHYVSAQPTLQEYARFRAQHGDQIDETSRNYHLYVQWLCAEQIVHLRDHARAQSIALYLDFPLGVNRDGFDVARQPDLFALGCNGGAPPDGLFVKGQNWGFPPLHPDAIRRQGYRYYIDCLRHHMGAAGMLRIDHVMGLHRAYWVPEGFSATDGLYVHYRAPEFYAILNLESQRHRVQIIGENLGTVPDFINQTMARRKIFGMHVGQFGVGADGARALESTPSNVVASLNTHDTATFMGFWQEQDIDDRVALGLLTNDQAQQERGYRAAQRGALSAYLRTLGYLGADDSPAAVLAGWLKFIAAQPADFLLINLEDLWLEPTPQNVPGTWQERPNWQRKTRYSLAELRGAAESIDLLRTISDIRARMV